MLSDFGPYWFFLNSSWGRSLSGCSPLSSLGLVRYCRKRNAPCQAVEPERPEPDEMPDKLGWLRTVTEPFATWAKACKCIAKAYTCTLSISLPAKARDNVSMLMFFGLMSPASSYSER